MQFSGITVGFLTASYSTKVYLSKLFFTVLEKVFFSQFLLNFAHNNLPSYMTRKKCSHVHLFFGLGWCWKPVVLEDLEYYGGKRYNLLAIFLLQRLKPLFILSMKTRAIIHTYYHLLASLAFQHVLH